MLKVKLELHPFGIHTKKKVLGTMLISNDGSGTSSHGNYDVSVYTDDHRNLTARVLAHPRKVPGGAWSLVSRAIEAIKWGS